MRGLFSALALTTAVAISPPERRGRTIAIVTNGQALAVLAGVPLGAFVVSLYGWRVIFAAIAVLSLLVVVGLAWNLPRGVPGERVTIRERLGAIRLPGIPRALVSTLLFMLAQFTVTIFIVPLAAYAGAVGAQLLPVLLFAYGVGAVTGTQLGGQIADRIGPRRTTILAAAAQAVLLIALAAAGALPSAAGSIVLFVIVPGIAVMGWGFYMAQSSLISSIVPGSPALALSLNLTALNIGVALAARLGGAILDQAGAFWLAAMPICAAVAALLTAGVLFKRWRPGKIVAPTCDRTTPIPAGLPPVAVNRSDLTAVFMGARTDPSSCSSSSSCTVRRLGRMPACLSE